RPADVRDLGAHDRAAQAPPPESRASVPRADAARKIRERLFASRIGSSRQNFAVPERFAEVARDPAYFSVRATPFTSGPHSWRIHEHASDDSSAPAIAIPA